MCCANKQEICIHNHYCTIIIMKNNIDITHYSFIESDAVLNEEPAEGCCGSREVNPDGSSRLLCPVSWNPGWGDPERPTVLQWSSNLNGDTRLSVCDHNSGHVTWGLGWLPLQEPCAPPSDSSGRGFVKHWKDRRDSAPGAEVFRVLHQAPPSTPAFVRHRQ